MFKITEPVSMGPSLRDALRWLDTVDLAFFLAEQWSCDHLPDSADREDDIVQCRGWKLFLLLPRLLLFPPPRGFLIPNKQLQNRFSLFSPGEWEQLLLQSEECVAAASKAFQRKRRTQTDTPERRADRAESFFVMGENSAGRHSLEGALLAPGTQRTLDQFRGPCKTSNLRIRSIARGTPQPPR